MIHATGTPMAGTANESWTYDRIVAEGLDPRDWEVASGELVERAPMSFAGAHLVVRLGRILDEHVSARGLGAILGGERFVLSSSDPRIERRPDLAFLVRSRCPDTLTSPPFTQGAPDLAIEIYSPTDSLTELTARLQQHLEYGAREGWLVAPELQTITVFKPGRPPRAYSRGDALESPELLPGLSLSIERLFAWPPQLDEPVPGQS